MSGQQIGTVIGGVIGAYFGGPAGAQLGMAIGGAIGGAVDPTHINGPKIGDGQQQRATDGNPIAWVQGDALIAGTIVQVSKRRQIRHKDDGKGSGTVQVTYTAQQDFAILVCESCSLRDSTMTSVLVVIQDGKIVYDVRPGSTMLSDSYKWKSNVDFMFGDEGQLPHPTLEAITGVGNTPAYRGSLVAVFKNFDVSTPGDRIPNFQFVVSSKAVLTPYLRSVWSGKSDPSETFDVLFPSATTGDLMIAYIGYAVQFGTDELSGLPAGWTVQHNNTSGNTGRWMCVTKVLEPGGETAFTLTGTMFKYYGAWTCQTYTVAAGSYDASTLTYDAGGGASPVPPSMTLSGGGGSLFIANDYDARYSPPITQWPAPFTNLETDQPYTSYYGTAPDSTAIMATTVQVTTGLSTAWTGKFAPLDGANATTLGVARHASTGGSTPGTLQAIVEAICKRGGLSPSDFDASALSDVIVAGYPIARQANAADCLLPLMQAYFGYGSEYDAKLHFKYYGDDALVTIAPDDLLENANSDEGDVTSNLRNQATEFPRRVVASYMDPAQNFSVVNVAAERRSIDVTAIGDQSFQIPVVMSADDATKAANKALKVAYATLQGTLGFSTPFAGSDSYITVAAGEPIIFRGKRYVADEMVLGNGSIKFTPRYDRQSAYTSNVQAIVGNAPSTPSSPYSGPTMLVPMNLPSQRPQDTVGIYVTAAGATGQESWRGCVVQVSYDEQASWVSALTIPMEATIGEVALDEPTGGEPITVNSLKYPLESVTTAQLAVKANGCCTVNAAGDAQLWQFGTATETATDLQFELTDTSRSLAGTTAYPVSVGDAFTLMDAAYFLPIDQSFQGRTLYLRGVGYGENAEDATIYSLVYLALVQATGQSITSEAGVELTAEDDFNILYTEQ